MTTIQTNINELALSEKVLARLQKERLPIRTAFRLQRVIQQVAEHLRTFGAVRVNLIENLSDGGDTVPEGKIPEFREKITDLALNEKVEVEVDFTIDDFGDSVKISAEEAELISFLFVH